jgi:hypothetical protein
MEFNKVLDAAKMVIVIALVFNLLMLGIGAVFNLLGIGAGVVARGGTQSGIVLATGSIILVWFAEWGLKIITVLGNVAIFAYCGFHAAKKGNDLVGCGMAGLVSYALAGVVCGAVGLLLSFFGIGATMFTSGSAMAGAFSGLIGAIGLGMGLVCGVFWYLGGLPLNFILALIGGLIGGAK